VKTAYERAMQQKLAEKQAKQREMQPRKVAQTFLREWLGKQGFGGVMDVHAAASLVDHIEAIVVAERAAVNIHKQGGGVR
jgi:hypothetical protein